MSVVCCKLVAVQVRERPFLSSPSEVAYCAKTLLVSVDSYSAQIYSCS